MIDQPTYWARTRSGGWFVFRLLIFSPLFVLACVGEAIRWLGKPVAEAVAVRRRAD